MNCKFPSNTHKKEATIFNQMGGSAVTNKPKPKIWQVVSGRYNRLSNNENCSINQSPLCANQNINFETPPVNAQTTKKTRLMESNYPSRCLPGYHHTRSSYSEIIDTISTTRSYTKEGAGIDTGMVRVTLPFNGITSTLNVIIVK